MLSAAKTSFYLLIFSLPFMKHNVTVGNLAATVTDLFFVGAAGFLALAILRRQVRVDWHPVYAILLAYLGAMLASAAVTEDGTRTALKLATQVYLISLPFLAICLIDSRSELRKAFQVWLAATSVTAAIGTATVLLFVLGIDRDYLEYGLHHYGTLVPGHYPRIEATFDFPAMLCNYLTVSLAILLSSRRLGWISAAPFYGLLAAIVTTAVFSLTPGLGGIFLAAGLWAFVTLREQSPSVARASLTGGALAALVFVAAAAVTPIVHPTAPFLIYFPGLDQPLAPAVRLLTWIDGFERFLDHPLLGTGIGSNAVSVNYVSPSGASHQLTDAHNVVLNFAAQCGLLGLTAMLVLVIYVGKLTVPLRLTGRNCASLALGLAWLNAFVYQGLTGSYEDARHLWVALGLLLASTRIEQQREFGSLNKSVTLHN